MYILTDSMYYHQAMKQPDRENFIEAIEKGLQGHYKEGNYELFPRAKIPMDALDKDRRDQQVESKSMHWKATLPGKVNQARHSMCCSSMCQILQCPQSLTCTGCEENLQIPLRDKG